MTYWLDESRGLAFCLIEAPDKAGVEEMHRNSHGLVPHKVIEVNNELVESFLGRIHDPEKALISDNGLKVFSEPALRIILLTEMTELVLLRQRLGPGQAEDLINGHISIIRNELKSHAGREVEHSGNGFVISFSSASSAITCAMKIQKCICEGDRRLTGFRIAVNAGEPVGESDRLFGDALKLARRLCSLNSQGRIIISSGVKELVSRDYHRLDQDHLLAIPSQEENLLGSLLDTLENHWQRPEFDVSEFCRAMVMSKSQLYRKTMAFWGVPPNLLIREFRLDKARDMLKKQSFNISQTTFDSGFNSPSYFTKCFKKKFGMLPASYQDSFQ
jgi:class 3 adenylate cyclase